MNVELKGEAERHSLPPASGPPTIASVVMAQASGEVGRIAPDVGKADLRVTAEGAQGIRFLNRKAKLLRLPRTRELRSEGPPRPVAAVDQCCPS